MVSKIILMHKIYFVSLNISIDIVSLVRNSIEHADMDNRILKKNELDITILFSSSVSAS